MRVGFLGPAGTFTEQALRASLPADAVVEEVAYPTVFEAVMAVQSGAVERTIVPIENSLEGSVTATLDALAIEAPDVRIVAEVVQPISHCLAARPGVGLESVSLVISHPQGLAQCRRFLAERLPGVGVRSASSTADAVREVSESGEPWAALGPRLAAARYGCEVLAAHAEDSHDNSTRFVWLAATETRPPVTPTKTSVVFWGFNDDSPGALVAVLDEFASRGVNLTKIESRPRRVRLGHYMFFVDIEGGAEDSPVADALAGLRHRVETLRVLGSYGALEDRHGGATG